MPQPKIAFVGFGEAARCFASHLAAQTGAPMVAFCQGKTNAPPYSEAFRALAGVAASRSSIGSRTSLTRM